MTAMTPGTLPLLPARYQARQTLQDNAIAHVLLADDRDTGGPVLLKLFHPDCQHAYRREAAAALALAHPRLVRCLDTFYLPGGEACLAYEYLEAGSLAGLLPERIFTRRELLGLLEELLTGLEFLHERGFVHCDLKPDNILVRHHDPDGGLSVVIGDLGSATPLKEARSGKHATGSPAYTAPERLFEGFAPNSDLYSLGVMTYQLYCGHLPFIGSVQDIYRAHLMTPPALGEILDHEIRHLTGMLLEKDPHRRIRSAGEALRLVRNLLRPHEAPDNVPAPAGTRAGLLQPASLTCCHRGMLEQEPAHLAVGGEGPWIALAFGEYIRFLDRRGQPLGPVQFSPGPLLPDDDGTVLFPVRTGLSRFSPAIAGGETLDMACRQAIALCHSGDRMAWLDHRQMSIHHADGSVAAVRPHRTYTLQPVICPHPGGGFLVSGGLANQDLLHVDTDGEIRSIRTPGGPVLAVTSDDRSVLAACVLLEASKEILFWRLGPDGCRECHEPAGQGEIVAARGLFYWQRDNLDIVAVDHRLQPAVIGRLPKGERLRAASPCGHYLLTTAGDGATRQYTLWRVSAKGDPA